MKIALRDVKNSQETFEGSPRSCHTRFMWLNWCPVDIVLWVLVVAVVLLVIWRTLVHKSGRRATAENGHVPHQRLGHRRLYCRPHSMVVDPYHIPHTFGNSPISNNTSLGHVSKPTSVLGDKTRISPPGLTPETHARNWVEGSGSSTTRPLNDSEDPFWTHYTAQFDVIAPPRSPPPAYVRSPGRWDM